MILISAVTPLFFSFLSWTQAQLYRTTLIKTRTSRQSWFRWDEIVFNRITFFFFWELVKNEKSQAQNWTEVSVWQKQIDRRSRWIQYWLIRWILWDSWALPNTAHPLQLNPYKIPTPNTKLHILKGTKSHTKVHHWNTSCNTNNEN